MRLTRSPSPISPVLEDTPLLPHDDLASLLSGGREYRFQRAGEARGLTLMATSALFFSMQSFLVSLGGRRLHLGPAVLVLARSVLQTVMALGLARALGASVVGPEGVRGWLVARGVLGGAGLAFFFYSLTQLPLADATVVFFTGPAFTALFAHLFLGEPFSRLDKAASALCLVGVAFVAKPTFLFPTPTAPVADAEAGEIQRLLAVGSALAGAILAALAYTTVRKVGTRAHFLAHTVYFGTASMIISLGMMTVQWARGGGWGVAVGGWGWGEWCLLLGIGFAAFGGQCCLNRGLQLAPAGPGTLMRNLDVVFAYILGITLLGDIPDVWGVSGAVIVVGCTVGVGLYKWLQASREHGTMS